MVMTYLRLLILEALSRFRIAPLSANAVFDEELGHLDMAWHSYMSVGLQRLTK